MLLFAGRSVYSIYICIDILKTGVLVVTSTLHLHAFIFLKLIIKKGQSLNKDEWISDVFYQHDAIALGTSQQLML